MKLNIFQYFKASGKAYYLDERRQRTFWKVPGGVNVIPWDGSYTQWISESFYDRETQLDFQYFRKDWIGAGTAFESFASQIRNQRYAPPQITVDERDLLKMGLVIIDETSKYRTFGESPVMRYIIPEIIEHSRKREIRERAMSPPPPPPKPPKDINPMNPTRPPKYKIEY